MLAGCPYAGHCRNVGRDEVFLLMPRFLIVAWSAVGLIPRILADGNGHW